MNILPVIKQHPIIWSAVAVLVAIMTITAIWGRFKPLPKGMSVQTEWLPATQVKFLTDKTYRERRNGHRVVEQQVFSEIYRLIDQADQFLIVDMFLFNDEYDREFAFPSISTDLANQLIRRKSENPKLDIQVITDPINTFYGAYSSEIHRRLSDAGIKVTYTDLDKLRHSNPIFSTVYAPFLSHFGTKGKGWIANPFSPDSPKVPLRAILKMLNFRANHRKVALSEKEAIISSANPHDASGYHSNIAFSVKGPILHQIALSEQAVIRFSSNPAYAVNTSAIQASPTAAPKGTDVRWITEGKIRTQWLEILHQVEQGDEVDIAMFYLSDRKIVEAIEKAAKTGATVRLILDANKDAFGREKNGIPNRQIAHELLKKIKSPNLSIRWYYTQGEQFHSKLMAARLYSTKTFYVIGGSANLTKRNIGDFNLEADICVRTPLESPLRKELALYFNRMWNNESGYFTDDYESYADDSRWKTLLYRIQDFTGACTF